MPANIPVLHHANRALAFMAVVFLCLFLPINSLYAAPLTVTVVLSGNGEVYQEFANKLKEKLSGKNVLLVIMDNPSEPIPSTGLVISVGMKAASAIAASKAPSVLNVLTPSAGYDQLLHDFPMRAHSRSFSAIYMDQPMERQIRLIKALLPGRPRVGIMYDNLPPDDLDHLRQRATRHRLSLSEYIVGPDTSLYSALQALLQENDLLLVLPDDSVFNSSTIRNILLATYRRGIPMIGFSPGYVNAGALGAVYSTPAHIAEQAVLAIQQFGETRILPNAQYPQQFEVAINEQVAKSLGLRIKSIGELHREINAFMGDEP